jgi:hypothetical protein
VTDYEDGGWRLGHRCTGALSEERDGAKKKKKKKERATTKQKKGRTMD